MAHLNPRRGTEPGKARPVLIVQAQALLDAGHPSTLIIPLTTNVVSGAEPLRVPAPTSGRLLQNSDLLVDQLRTINNQRLVDGPLATLDAPTMRKVAEAIREVLELTE